MRAKELVETARLAADDKKALDPIILKLGPASGIASYFLIVHGTSDTHVRAIADHVVNQLKKKKTCVWHLEGFREGRWVLIDYGDVVIHVFHYEAREFYGLERLWGDSKRIG